MNRNSRRMRAATMAVVAANIALGACTASGSGNGMLSGGGRPMGQAQFAWNTRGGDSAELTAILPDGERFSGRATSVSTRSQPGVGFVVGPRRGETAVVLPTDGKNWTGEIDATLLGDRGRSMHCVLRERRAGMGLESGASGTCRISDGREIAVVL